MTPYGQRALNGELAALRAAGNGERNSQLNKSAFALATLVANGDVDADIARRELSDAAKTIGLDDCEIQSTLTSAWKAGEANPRRHLYQAADGRTLYAKARVDRGGMKYAYQHVSGSQWVNGKGDAKHQPYRLIDILAAPTTAPLYTAEGEKHADKLAGWGLLATSHKDWRDDFAPYVAGRTVIILPDNDETGFNQAEDAAHKISLAGGFPYIVELPGLPPLGDIIDWDGDKAALELLVADALAEGPHKDAKTQETQPTITATPYAFIDPATITPRPWVYGYWLLRGTATAVVAPGGIGKSTLLCGTALSIITGRPLLGKTVWGGPKRVWIWNLEDPLEELTRSIQAASLHYGLTASDVEGRLFVDTAMEGKGLCTAIEGPEGFKLLAPVYVQITAELKRREIDVLVIDPFVSSHEVEENSNIKIDKIAKAWGRVANDAGCCVVLVHHTSKAGSGDVTAMSARGAKSLTDACRAALVLNRMDDDTAAQHGFSDKERRRYFTVQDDKHNRAPADNADWYKLESVHLGNGLDGGDSVGVATVWAKPDPFDGVTVDHLYQVQVQLDAGLHRADAQANDWAGNVVAEVLGLDPHRASDKARIKQLIKTWLENGALKKEDRYIEKRREEKPCLVVGKWAIIDNAQPLKGWAGQSGAVEQNCCPTTTPTLSGGWGRAVLGDECKVGQQGEAK